MNNIRICMIGFAVVLVSIIGGTTAHAARKMLVLIDASGSMTIPRPADAVNPTRFDAAKARAKSQIVDQARLGLDGVAVYTFSDSSATPRTVGFVDPNVARATIDGLDLFTVGGGSTPLAGSLCDAVDALVAEAPALTDIRILQLSSDGEENSTPLGTHCQGPFSTLPDPPYSGGSWQHLVLNYVVDHDVAPYIDLFDPGPIVGFAARARAADPEAAVTAKLRSSAAAAGLAAEGPPTLAAFFAELAREGGGRLTVVTDQQPQLPVFADFNGNNCVDRSDALLVARAFGQVGSPQDVPLDLDADGKVGFTDYALVLGGFTPGGCGTPEPYVSRAPIVCSIAQSVVIDGQSIEGGGITVDVRGACRLTIRNSLIVSGQNAIKVLGSALITVDNSILVGESAVLMSQGATVLSAAKTVFHGKRTTQGAFVLIDRGGNTFE